MNRITFKSRRKYSEVTQKAVEENLPEFTDCLLLTVYRKLVHFLPVNSYTSETASYLGNGPASYGLTRIILNYSIAPLFLKSK